MITYGRERLLFTNNQTTSMKIAVCVDDDSPSQRALEEAVEFAEVVDGDIVLLHSVQKTVDNTQNEIIREGSTKAIERGHELLDRMQSQVNKHAQEHVNVSKEILPSDNGTVNEIRDYVSKNSVDHVFIGHRALDKRKEELFGSFAKNMISVSDVPVTVISD